MVETGRSTEYGLPAACLESVFRLVTNPLLRHNSVPIGLEPCEIFIHIQVVKAAQCLERSLVLHG